MLKHVTPTWHVLVTPTWHVLVTPTWHVLVPRTCHVLVTPTWHVLVTPTCHVLVTPTWHVLVTRTCRPQWPGGHRCAWSRAWSRDRAAQGAVIESEINTDVMQTSRADARSRAGRAGGQRRALVRLRRWLLASPPYSTRQRRFTGVRVCVCVCVCVCVFYSPAPLYGCTSVCVCVCILFASAAPRPPETLAPSLSSVFYSPAPLYGCTGVCVCVCVCILFASAAPRPPAAPMSTSARDAGASRGAAARSRDGVPAHLTRSCGAEPRMRSDGAVVQPRGPARGCPN
jgi:hypothetical protein